MFTIAQNGAVELIDRDATIDTTDKIVRTWYSVGSHRPVVVVFPKQPSQAAKSAIADLMNELIG